MTKTEAEIKAGCAQNYEPYPTVTIIDVMRDKGLKMSKWPMWLDESRLMREGADHIEELTKALEECLSEHGGFTIKGECEKRARVAIEKAKGVI